MSNELDKRREAALLAMVEGDHLPTVPELDLAESGTTKIPLAHLAALGVAFQPLTSVIQTALSGSGGSGLYYVNTFGKQMFSTPEGCIGALKAPNGGVGGGQARMTELLCDPTMLFMAAALVHIEKKLDSIEQTQKDILEFLEAKERALLQGNLNSLGEIMGNFKYHWDNPTYKSNKHILVQQIKKEAEGSMILYRDQIAENLKKRTFIHSDREVKNILKKLETQFKDYQLALYLYSYASFLEVMLMGNFGEEYLNNVERRISEYAAQYQALYTDCYNRMEAYSKSSVQAGVLNGLAAASKFMGETIAKVPGIRNSQLDENLIEAGNKLDQHGDRRATGALEGLAQTRLTAILPFVENIRTINALYNKPAVYLFDNENLYVRQIVE